MQFGKKLTVGLLSLIITVTTFSTAEARSVYVITKHTGNKIAAYEIQGDQIDWQATADVPPHEDGAVGLALDYRVHPYSGVMFVTYEGSNIIEMVNARTLAPLGKSKTVTGTTNLAGIVFDQSKQKLYVIKRRDNRLYVYLWNPIDKTLTLEGDTYKTLENIGTYPNGAYGIALNQTKKHLYVTDSTNTVRFYDTNDPNFGYKGSVDIVVGANERKAVGIAIDPNRHYLYTGSWSGASGDHTFLVRTDISDINNPTFDEYNVGAYVIGVTADEETGFIYTTDKNDTIKVFDTATFPSDPCDTIADANIYHPADIIVAGDVSYKPLLPPLLKLEKIDDVEDGKLPSPGDYVTYTIKYDANGYDVNNAVIVDYLPEEIDINDVNISGPNNVYDPNYRTVTWDLGSLSPNDSNYVTVTVRIDPNIDSVPIIANYCELETDTTYNAAYCFIPDVIYVDVDANDPNSHDNGTSWFNAYTDLQDALAAARALISFPYSKAIIRVAEGTYKPTDDPEDYEATFSLVDGVAIYGGFAGYGQLDPDDRDIKAYETILSGDIDNNGNADDIWHVVTCSGVTVIDGFTIKKGVTSNIYCNGGSPTIRDNIIEESGTHGLQCENYSSANISNCQIQNNGSYGINCKDSDVTINHCLIENNISHGGIYCSKGTAVIENNWISDNGNYGICLSWLNEAAEIRNNTIIDNGNYGIFEDGVAPNDPNVSNCIVWDNKGGGVQLSGCTASYSCVQNGGTTNGNINDNPDFVNDPNNPNNYHIIPSSPCIDTGDPTFSDYNEVDIDGEMRIFDGDDDGTKRVDMGADEFYRSPADFDEDGAVKFPDYSLFANCWLDDEPNYSLDDDNDVDYNDVDLFCGEWLWQAAWTIENWQLPMGGRGGGMGRAIQQSESTDAEDQQADIERFIYWLDDAWLASELADIMTDDEYLAFRDSLEELCE